jgi:hypothetical protein
LTVDLTDALVFPYGETNGAFAPRVGIEPTTHGLTVRCSAS